MLDLFLLGEAAEEVRHGLLHGLHLSVYAGSAPSGGWAEHTALVARLCALVLTAIGLDL